MRTQKNKERIKRLPHLKHRSNFPMAHQVFVGSCQNAGEWLGPMRLKIFGCHPCHSTTGLIAVVYQPADAAFSILARGPSFHCISIAAVDPAAW
jgi:hypothetical protein